MSVDLDDLLDGGKRAEMEARFRELEREAEIEELRRKAGVPPGAAGDAPDPGKARRKPAAPDPLADMKAALNSDEPLERYLLVLCPACDARNRMSLTRVRGADPICGRCKADLSFSKV